MAMAGVQVLEFDVASIEANSGGAISLGTGVQIHHFTLMGAQGEKLMFTFSASTVDISVQKQDPTFYVIESPLSEHASSLAHLQAILPRPLKVRVTEAPNGVYSWQFTGALI